MPDLSRSAEMPAGYGHWSLKCLAVAAVGGGIAGVGRVCRDVGRERESKSNGDSDDETTERHEWVLLTPPANLSLGPSLATIGRRPKEVKERLSGIEPLNGRHVSRRATQRARAQTASRR